MKFRIEKYEKKIEGSTVPSNRFFAITGLGTVNANVALNRVYSEQ